MNESPVKNIKTREVKRDIKVLDKAAEAAKSMKQTTIRTKDQMQNLMDDGQISPEEYAEEKMRYAAEDTASEAGHQMKNAAKKTTKKVRKRVRDRREQKLQEKQMKQAEESRRTVAEAEKQTAETVVEESQEGPLPRRKNNTAPKVEQATFRQREYGVQQHEARVRRLRKAKVTVTEVEAGRTAQTTAIYAIKVGRTTLDMLNVSKELDMDVSIIPKDNPSYVDEAEPEEGNTGRRDLDVFDVLLAGVESDD